MTRTIPLARRRIAVVAQLGCYPLAFILTTVLGWPSGLTTGVALLGVLAASLYLYYKTGLWQFGNAPDDQVDERQVQIRNQAYRFAYIGLGTLVMLVLVYLNLANDFHWPVLTGSDQFNSLFWGVWTFVLVLPSAILAWTEPDVYGVVEDAQSVESVAK